MSNENQRQIELNAICEEAYQKIPSFYDEDLWKKHKDWGENRKPFKFSYKIKDSSVLTVGVSHTNKPESPTTFEIKKTLADYINSTSLEQQLVMVEGFHSGEVKAGTTFEESLITYGESGAIVFIAQQSKTPVISPEVEIAQNIQKIKWKFGSEETALFYVLRDLKKDKTPQEIAKIIYKYSNMAGCEWLPEKPEQINEEWLQNLLAGGTTKLNTTMIKLTKKPLFDVATTRVILEASELNTFISPGLEAPETNLKHISQEDATERDKYLIKKIVENSQSKKSPLVFFGGTHILRIDPALKHIETSLS